MAVIFLMAYVNPGPRVVDRKKKRRASLVAQMVKNLPTMRETWV